MVHEAFKRGWSLSKLFELTKIDPWFLDHLEELTCFEEEIKTAGTIEGLKKDIPFFTQIKEMGYSDRQIAFLLSTDEALVRKKREEINLFPVYGLVDTCAAEFKAFTPYFYSTYGENDESMPSDKKKVMIIGSGPNRIGQGI